MTEPKRAGGAPPSTPMGKAIARVRTLADRAAPGIPVHGGANAAKGRAHWAAEAGQWAEFNEVRRELDLLGQDGGLAEALFAALAVDPDEDPDAYVDQMLGVAAHAIASALYVEREFA